MNLGPRRGWSPYCWGRCVGRGAALTFTVEVPRADLYQFAVANRGTVALWSAASAVSPPAH